jgi:WD40 repeat protein
MTRWTRNVFVWNATTGKVLLTYTNNPTQVNGGLIRYLAWSPDGTRIVVGDGFGVIHILDATNAQPLLTCQGFSGSYETLCMAWSPDSKRVATGGMGVGQNVNTVQVWDSTSGQTLATFGGQPQGVNAVSWSPNGADIAAGGQDGTVQIWKAP